MLCVAEKGWYTTNELNPTLEMVKRTLKATDFNTNIVGYSRLCLPCSSLILILDPFFYTHSQVARGAAGISIQQISRMHEK